MGTHRMLDDTVILYNYLGEYRDVAQYQVTILNHCYCPLSTTADANNHGKNPINSARLYIFDENTVASSENGVTRTYIPYDDWLSLSDKSGYWTLSDKGNDYFKKFGEVARLRIVSFSHKVAGRRRMWHFEVDGK